MATKVFADNRASVMAIADTSRKVLIHIQPVSNNVKLFPDTFIMNFESADKSDYQLNKSLSNTFLFNAFGHSVTTIVVSGFQADAVYADSDVGVNSVSSTPPVNIEEYYRKYCISSDTPALFKLAISEADAIMKNPTIYHAYMVSFTRKPMGEAKVNGYGFSISFIGTVSEAKGRHK